MNKIVNEIQNNLILTLLYIDWEIRNYFDVQAEYFTSEIKIKEDLSTKIENIVHKQTN